MASDIPWAVASITEGEPDLESEKSPKRSLVDRDSATRRARRLDVEYDVGELGFPLRSIRNREAALAFNFHGTTHAMVGLYGPPARGE